MVKILYINSDLEYDKSFPSLKEAYSFLVELNRKKRSNYYAGAVIKLEDGDSFFFNGRKMNREELYKILPVDKRYMCYYINDDNPEFKRLHTAGSIIVSSDESDD